MTVILFIIVLVLLIIAHEFGHFIAAKATGMRVDEFGIGLPPKAWGFKPKKSETEYTLNWLPFGGFVRIWGEDMDEESAADTGRDDGRQFGKRSKWAQALTLIAGVTANALVAWVLLSIGFMTGLPMSVETAPESARVEQVGLTILSVLEDSPADTAGMMPGDVITALTTDTHALQNIALTTDVSDFIVAHGDEEITVLYKRLGEPATLAVTPEGGITEGRPAIGITMDMVGTVKLPFFAAFWEGLKATWALIAMIAVGFTALIADIFKGTADLSSVAGPVGIAGMFGNATEFGVAYVLYFVAFISANLAVLNLLPFPALDGGRLLFVLIESIKGSAINPKIAGALNSIGFAALMLLILVVTWQDIVRLLE
jgi:regulator of sigma E protease